MSVITILSKLVKTNFSKFSSSLSSPEISVSPVVRDSDSIVPEVGAESLDASMFQEVLNHTNSVISTTEITNIFLRNIVAIPATLELREISYTIHCDG
ncbi:MAG: hypothetical protein LBE12_06800 [Planctomycetaceae bacterium]|jgi:hypothetical protein|nr:hypothetical protein [Planctomycetaceae bacterium]